MLILRGTAFSQEKNSKSEVISKVNVWDSREECLYIGKQDKSLKTEVMITRAEQSYAERNA